MTGTLRQALRTDVREIQRVRHSVRENVLTSCVISDAEVVEAIEATGRGWVIEEGGEIVGFAIGNASNGNIWALFIEPGCEGRGYGRRLHDEMVAWLWSRGLRRLWLTTEADTRAQRFYERAGWRNRGPSPGGEIRFELDAPRAMGERVTIRLLGPADAALLGNVAPGVFDNEVDIDLTAEFLADPRHHMVVAMLDDQVVGMASAVDYIHPDKPREFWINEVGVAPSHQRQGIGKQVLEALLAHARSLGCRDAWLGTEEDNVAARRLYASAGGKQASMVYVTFEFD